MAVKYWEKLGKSEAPDIEVPRPPHSPRKSTHVRKQDGSVDRGAMLNPKHSGIPPAPPLSVLLELKSLDDQHSLTFHTGTTNMTIYASANWIHFRGSDPSLTSTLQVFDLSALIKKLRKGGSTEFRKVNFFPSIKAVEFANTFVSAPSSTGRHPQKLPHKTPIP